MSLKFNGAVNGSEFARFDHILTTQVKSKAMLARLVDYIEDHLADYANHLEQECRSDYENQKVEDQKPCFFYSPPREIITLIVWDKLSIISYSETHGWSDKEVSKYEIEMPEELPPAYFNILYFNEEVINELEVVRDTNNKNWSLYDIHEWYITSFENPLSHPKTDLFYEFWDEVDFFKFKVPGDVKDRVLSTKGLENRDDIYEGVCHAIYDFNKYTLDLPISIIDSLKGSEEYFYFIGLVVFWRHYEDYEVYPNVATGE